jgi:uncharacterized repeat protein (TIGR01451 family)
LAGLIRYQIVVRNYGPAAASGVRLVLSFPLLVAFQSASIGSCSGSLGQAQCSLGSLASGGSITFEIRVLTLQLGTVTATAAGSANEPDPSPSNDSASANTRVTLLQREPGEIFARLSIRLDAPPSDGGDRGQVTVDNRLSGIDDMTPAEFELSTEPGEHVLEAVLTDSSGRRGLWRFQFRISPGLELSDIQIDDGNAVSVEPRSILFSVRGESGERLRFRYRLFAR